jgi:hypothetical protein
MQTEYTLEVHYSGKPVAKIDDGIIEHAESMGGKSTGSGYCFMTETRDIMVTFGTHMEANKFKAAVLTEPSLRDLTEDVKVELSDITKTE